jgi:hypothetical protein
MPLTLPDGLQRTKANGADHRYLWVGSSTRVALLHTLRRRLDIFGPLLQHLDAEREASARAIRASRTATLTHNGHFSCLERPREGAQLIREPA